MGLLEKKYIARTRKERRRENLAIDIFAGTGIAFIVVIVIVVTFLYWRADVANAAELPSYPSLSNREYCAKFATSFGGRELNGKESRIANYCGKI